MRKLFSVLGFSCASILAISATARGGMTLLTGPQIGTHVGNLVVNGSFETGAPAAGSSVYWATGTTSTPFAAPASWTSSGTADNYALWGSDQVSSPWTIEGSATLPDGHAGLYFGNGTGVASSVQPTFNPDGTVGFASPPTFFPKPNYALPVTISQTVPTNATPAASYILSFWVSGEDTGFAPSTPFSGDGIFGLRVTNVLAGDPTIYLTTPSGLSGLGTSMRYEFSFVPLNPLVPVDVEFINWGHFALNTSPLTTELVLDDVIVNAVDAPEPASIGLIGLATISALMRRRR